MKVRALETSDTSREARVLNLYRPYIGKAESKQSFIVCWRSTKAVRRFRTPQMMVRFHPPASRLAIPTVGNGFCTPGIRVRFAGKAPMGTWRNR